MNYYEALEYFNIGKIKKCTDYFRNNGYMLEYAYSLLLSGRQDESAEIFGTILSVRADWALKLIKIIQGSSKYLPSFFQIRNFLEIDVNLLLRSGQAEYVSKLADNAELFQNINQESYKFFGRVLLKNNQFDISEFFLEKALNVCYNDPELHFLRMELYYVTGDIVNTHKSLNACLAVSPDYYPAQKIMQDMCGGE